MSQVSNALPLMPPPQEAARAAPGATEVPEGEEFLAIFGSVQAGSEGVAEAASASLPGWIAPVQAELPDGKPLPPPGSLVAAVAQALGLPPVADEGAAPMAAEELGLPLQPGPSRTARGPAAPQAAASAPVLAAARTAAEATAEPALPLPPMPKGEAGEPLATNGFSRMIGALGGREAALESGGLTASLARTEAALRSEGGTAVVRQTLDLPLGKPDWDQAFGQRIAWLVANRTPTAELRITPPQLGTIEVRIQVQQNETSVSFVVQNPAVREAIEAALPRLREMLGDSGLALANAHVAEHSARQGGRAGSQAGRGAHGFGGVEEAGEAGGPESTRPRITLGLVDDYA